MRRAPLPSYRPLVGVAVDGGWAAGLTERRFVDLGRTESMMCRPAAR